MRRTNKNPNGSFRVVGKRIGSFRIEHQLEETVLFGDVVDSLGEYEEIGTPEEFRILKMRYGTKK